MLTKLRDSQAAFTPVDYATSLETIPHECRAVLSTVENDMRVLDQTVPSRRAFLQLLSTREELANNDVDPSVANVGAFERRLRAIRADFEKQRAQLQSTLDEFQKVGKEFLHNPAGSAAAQANAAGQKAEKDPRREQLLELMSRLRGDFSEFTLTQGRCRVESVTLVPVELGSIEALDIARRNRLDWMNARAALVDAWRQVEVAANALRGDLNVVFSGDMSTLGNNPAQFRSTTGRLRAGLQFDPPLTRLAERNLYREALIDYQQARRQYCAYEDRVSQSLRDTLRTIGRYQLDFELRRAGVHVAISQVDVMQLRLQKPPKPGETTVLGATTARDLVQALTGLLSAQNGFLTAWVDYEVQRLNLDFDLGTMRLDAQSNWIDPGPIEPERTAKGTEPSRAPLPEEIPLPKPMPLEVE